LQAFAPLQNSRVAPTQSNSSILGPRGRYATDSGAAAEHITRPPRYILTYRPGIYAEPLVLRPDTSIC
jgi:hypothetical protein